MVDDQAMPRRVALGAGIAVVAIALSGLVVGVDVAAIALGVFAGAGAVARVVLPMERAFTIRRRAIDVAVLTVLAAILLFLGLTTPLD
ncbi:hypothetical protein [Demequina pelophila]|uniref:hypothetical protein n=1 Tax=Demequina pelophila TaxID=1638984 RepID=UPI0007824A85|nr:hypothetical protein [Demequina pelophila]